MLVGSRVSINGVPLRIELDGVFGEMSAYIDLGGQIYKVNHSGNNSCGPGGPRRPCSYNVKSEVGTIRLAVIRRFSL